ncbi:pilus assembly protein Flp/PilA [Blastococcus sp. DSM 46786]|uniref:Flp family type IVb pilin n=1 Tax=Blastococcus sp. DSM 46786 TaxID=1798227 RepID=UPI0008CCC8EA|nr:Flp family type IVb pilin [Blastococcus sp. DSM 46786]SEL46086.1 pilus assembly protein Flp/PilA [Blastococcus sp. DSM 46786]
MINAYATIASFVAVAQERLRRDEKGATAVEYGLMVGLIAVAIIVAVTALGGGLSDLFSDVEGQLPAVGGGTTTTTTP